MRFIYRAESALCSIFWVPFVIEFYMFGTALYYENFLLRIHKIDFIFFDDSPVKKKGKK